MNKRVVEYHETFRMWTYDPSHSRLLLRASGFNQNRRIEILFINVRSMEVGCLFNSIAVDEVDSGAEPNSISRCRFATEPGLKTYVITTRDWTGKIIAGNISWQEDLGEHTDPSSLFIPSVSIANLAKYGCYPL